VSDPVKLWEFEAERRSGGTMFILAETEEEAEEAAQDQLHRYLSKCDHLEEEVHFQGEATMERVAKESESVWSVAEEAWIDPREVEKLLRPDAGPLRLEDRPVLIPGQIRLGASS
jgi:hypothetical protein